MSRSLVLVLLVGGLTALTALTACSSGGGTGPPEAGTGPQPAASAAATPPVVIGYGEDPAQFGQLWLPAARSGSIPVVVLIHGGFWRGSYSLDLMEPLARDLTARGYAAWNIEYRRVGQPGGGYPGTLTDVAAAIDRLAALADRYSLDLADVVVVGHSAGGQLALWAAGRLSLNAGEPGAGPVVVPRLAVGQGPVFDLTAADAEGLGDGAVTDFLGGSSSAVAQRYAVATPRAGAGVPLVVVRGADDETVPARFTVPTPSTGVRIVEVPGDHFALIDPSSAAWRALIEVIASSSVG